MSRRQNEILNFILEDVFYALIAFRVFADVMVENTWLESLKLVNEALYHAGRAAFAGIVCIAAARAFRDGSVRKIRVYAVLLIGILSAFSGAELWMLEIAVLSVGLRGMKRDVLLRKVSTALVLAVVLIMLLAFSGIISGEGVARTDGTIRRSFGFSHPNVLGMRFFEIAAMHLYFRSKHLIRLRDAALVLLAGIFVYVAADSRTSTILLLLLGGAALLFAAAGGPRAGNTVLFGGALFKVFRVLPFAALLIPPAAVFGSLRLAGLPQAADMSSTIWSRINQSLVYYDYYGLSWHGRALMDRNSAGAPAGMYTLDNGYMYLLLGFGVFAFFLFLLGEMCLVFRASQDREWMLLIILVLYLLFGMLETSFIRPHCNLFVLLLAEALWPGETGERMKLTGGKREYTADRT